MNFYVSLDELYQRVDSQTQSYDGNPCGACNSCCTAASVSAHRVSELEFRFLEEKAGKPKTDQFRQYVARSEDEDGALLYPVCPNYSNNQCSVHEHRPYSCRMYGQFRADTEPLIEHCVFRESVVVVPKSEEKDRLPGTRELQSLLVDYSLYHSDLETTETASNEPKDFGSPAELGTYQLSQGQFQEAVKSLEEALESDPSPLVHWLLGQAYEEIGRFQDAEERYLESIALQPSNPRFHFYLGALLSRLVRFEEAQHPLYRAVELDSNLSVAAGVLGFVYTQLDDIESAINAYEVCLSREKEPTVFRLQLGLLYRKTGQEEIAQLLLQAATECEITKLDALAALAES